MQAILKAANRATHGLNWLVGWLIATLLAVMTVLITWQVFARYVMGSPLTFSEEIARFSMVWMTMLGAGYAFRYGALISVDIVSEFAPKRIARFVEISVVLLVAVFALVLLKEGWSLAERVSAQTAPSTRISMLWLYGAMPAGAVLILINAAGLLIDKATGEEPVLAEKEALSE
ncbi:TRAP transporter small permease [Aureimonas mangrovi]|uniref:TRAP transporter small permease n=1 Tax=Aureimonas mangrovi TaxID=2758041 RepID=UPI00163D6825|nr:TRAP transporter small permease [Aureimonas mangrovi]